MAHHHYVFLFKLRFKPTCPDRNKVNPEQTIVCHNKDEGQSSTPGQSTNTRLEHTVFGVREILDLSRFPAISERSANSGDKPHQLIMKFATTKHTASSPDVNISRGLFHSQKSALFTRNDMPSSLGLDVPRPFSFKQVLAKLKNRSSRAFIGVSDRHFVTYG